MAFQPLNPNGQASMANSSPVVIASDQSAVPVSLTSTTITGTVAATQSGTWTVQPGNTANTTAWKVDGSAVTQPVSGTVVANAGTNLNTSALNLETTQTAMSAKLPATLGQKAMTASMAVVLASDQASVPVAATLAAETTKVIGTVRNLGNAGAIFDQATGSAVPANALQVGFSDGTNLRAGTVNSTTTTAKFAQDANILSLAGTLVDTNSGNKSAGTQRMVIATDQPNLTTALNVALAANQSVNVAQFGGTNVVNGGTAGIQSIGGATATNVALTDNPLNLGAQAVSSENAAVTTARKVQLVADLVGKLIVLPYANPENFVSGAITSAMTGTTSTSCVAAPASGLRNYITQITVSNASTTVPTDILIQDGSGGTTLYVVPAPIGTGTGTGTSGGTFTFPTPLRQPTTATAIYVANVTTGSSTKVSISGYKGA